MIVVQYTPAAMTRAQYEQIMRGLEEAGALGMPGGLAHVCFGEEGRLSVTDVWESEEAFGPFRDKLLPIVRGLGVDTTYHVYPAVGSLGIEGGA
jgi:hypothetical protein